MKQVSKLAPEPRRGRSPAELSQELGRILHQEFSIPELPECSIILEGWIDVGYLRMAAELALKATGVDLLDAGASPDDGRQLRIGLVTPGKAGDASRGGVPQMVRLAERLQPFVWTIDMFRGLAFVFDHDEAGINAAQQIQDYGFRQDKNSITLNPKYHPGACAAKQVVIEDLLSRRIQQEFHACHEGSCAVEFAAGKAVRFRWGNESKGKLLEYVQAMAYWEDVKEIVRVLVRARKLLGLPISDSVIEFAGQGISVCQVQLWSI